MQFWKIKKQSFVKSLFSFERLFFEIENQENSHKKDWQSNFKNSHLSLPSHRLAGIRRWWFRIRWWWLLLLGLLCRLSNQTLAGHRWLNALNVLVHLLLLILHQRRSILNHLWRRHAWVVLIPLHHVRVDHSDLLQTLLTKTRDVKVDDRWKWHQFLPRHVIQLNVVRSHDSAYDVVVRHKSRTQRHRFSICSGLLELKYFTIMHSVGSNNLNFIPEASFAGGFAEFRVSD